jgi:hypothetical protein
VIDLAEQVRWEALRLSKLAVRAQLKARGDKLSDYKRSDLDRLAQAFFANHRELAGQVLGDLLWTRVADILTSEKKSKAHSVGLSRVQMSGSNVEAER